MRQIGTGDALLVDIDTLLPSFLFSSFMGVLPRLLNVEYVCVLKCCFGDFVEVLGDVCE